ncbi:MAG: hypothetical protein KY468_13990 [Armatimonadetes bacterium]|nr:hypothetical protein [Armatimonadota bacterium]
MQSRFRLMRLVRTTSSEVYVIWEGEERVGQLDLHYARDTIQGTLILETLLSISSEKDLLEQVDQDIVSSYLPIFERDNLLITIYRGEEINTYMDPHATLEEDEDETDDS